MNRIFEGTNEINRLLLAGQLVRRAAKGEVALIAAARALPEQLLALPIAPPEEPSALLRHVASGLKQATVMLLGAAMQRYQEQIADEQEVLHVDRRPGHRRLRRGQRGAARACG